MKVTDIRVNPKERYLSEIPDGTVFEYYHQFYIKIPRVRKAVSDKMYDAIHLSTGQPARIPSDIELRICNAEVLIS